LYIAYLLWMSDVWLTQGTSSRTTKEDIWWKMWTNQRTDSRNKKVYAYQITNYQRHTTKIIGFKKRKRPSSHWNTVKYTILPVEDIEWGM
jgi:hypothetical protein